MLYSCTAGGLNANKHIYCNKSQTLNRVSKICKGKS